jgi:hypothetical protein
MSLLVAYFIKMPRVKREQIQAREQLFKVIPRTFHKSLTLLRKPTAFAMGGPAACSETVIDDVSETG